MDVKLLSLKDNCIEKTTMKYEQKNWSADQESIKDLDELSKLLRHENKSATIRYAISFTLEALIERRKEAS